MVSGLCARTLGSAFYRKEIIDTYAPSVSLISGTLPTEVFGFPDLKLLYVVKQPSPTPLTLVLQDLDKNA